jgi:hypothetical protein
LTTLTLPNLTAAVNTTTDTITGQAPANRWFQVEIYIKQWYYKWLKSSATGTYSADFSSSVDIKPTDTLYIELYPYDPTTGNATFYEKLIAP